MNTPAHSFPFRSTFLLSGLTLAAALALPSYAASPDASIPSVSILNIKKNTEVVKAPPPAATGNSQGSQGKGGKNGQNNQNGKYGNAPKPPQYGSASTKSDLTYVISLRNNSKFPAKNVEVEYHFYNRTTVTTNGIGTSNIDDITSTENLDIDPTSNKDLITQPISHEDTMGAGPDTSNSSSSSGGGGGGRGGRNKLTASPISTSTITAVMGWHVEVRYNDKVIAHRDYPDNLQTLLKNYQPQQ